VAVVYCASIYTYPKEFQVRSHAAHFVSGSIEPGLSVDIWRLFLLVTVSFLAVFNFIALTDTTLDVKWKKLENQAAVLSRAIAS